MAYFHFPVAAMTYDIDPWCDLDLELKGSEQNQG